MIIVSVMHHDSLLQDNFFLIKFISPSPLLYFIAYQVLDIHRRLIIKSKVSILKECRLRTSFLNGTTK